MLAAIALSRAAAPNRSIRYAVALFSVCLLLYAVWLSYASNNNPGASYYNFDNANGIYASGGSELASLGFSGCRFISNAWVPMIYSGYPAYSPFVLYAGNSTVQIIEQTTARFGPGAERIILDVSKNQLPVLNATYRAQEGRYPILVFNYTGVAQSVILNLNKSRLAYSGQNLSIYLPPNATCYAPLIKSSKYGGATLLPIHAGVAESGNAPVSRFASRELICDANKATGFPREFRVQIPTPANVYILKVGQHKSDD